MQSAKTLGHPMISHQERNLPCSLPGPRGAGHSTAVEVIVPTAQVATASSRLSAADPYLHRPAQERGRKRVLRFLEASIELGAKEERDLGPQDGAAEGLS